MSDVALKAPKRPFRFVEPSALPGFKITLGFTLGTALIAVNGREYRPDRLKAAVTAAKTNHQPVELIVKNLDRYRTVKIAWFEGLKYPQLQRLDAVPDRLDAILKGGLPLRERLRLLLRIAEPVAFAHAHGVIHRDLKPENVMVGPFGEVLVMDWGGAKQRGESAAPGRAAVSVEASGGTAHGTIVGTPAYMSPEQAQGQPVDARCDLFSLGCVLYHMAAGRPPFRADTLTAVLLAIVQDNPPPVREVCSSVAS